MLWSEAEAAIRAYVVAQWALTAHAATPVQWENDVQQRAPTFVHINIEGIFAEKGIYGGTGKRLYVEGGIVYVHAFTPRGSTASASNKGTALSLVETMTGLLELQAISDVIRMDGANPPSPVDQGDTQVPTAQPSGNYFRCSGSVPFLVIGAK